MNDTFNDKKYSEAVEIAHMRFGAIAPVLQGLFAEPTKTAYYKKIAEKAFKMPNGKELLYNYNTFEKWEARYNSSLALMQH
ncbi:hypothetical protein [Acetivibrio cellulolyticus]|uniref:hypothetical protein n=1 Tax=Acetivibrio cellulolyticus TaxID=35830 RepID=UPI0001E2C6A6|nr:hypothetical protein [Acetivibrio cellulolyticus]